jgi:NADH-ubiquinone oxidoreductase chain 5
MYTFLNRKWFFDKIYNEFINQKLAKFGYMTTYKSIDRGFIEMLGPYGLSNIVFEKAFILKNLQNGIVYQYTLTILFSFIFGVSAFLISDSLISYMSLDYRVLFILFVCYFLKQNNI